MINTITIESFNNEKDIVSITAQIVEMVSSKLPVHDSHWIMLQRNLLYTGITRAKKKIILVGTKKAIGRSVTNNTIPHRQSNLKNLLDVWG